MFIAQMFVEMKRRLTVFSQLLPDASLRTIVYNYPLYFVIRVPTRFARKVLMGEWSATSRFAQYVRLRREKLCYAIGE